MKIIDCVQGSPEWFAARLGIPTASRFKDIVTPGGELSKSSVGYMNLLLAEIIAGKQLESFTNEWMERGTELEPMARDFYKFHSDQDVVEVGFVTNDSMTAGASPDGLIGTDGGLEIKCPSPQVHMAYMREGVIDNKYRPQIQGNMWICEREWWDSVSFHPELPPVIVRVQRDDKFIKKLSDAITDFNVELQAAYDDLKKRGVIP